MDNWIRKCKECDFESKLKPVEEFIDEDCKIDIFYGPKCKVYINQI